MHGFIQEIMSTHGGKLAMSLRDQCCTQDLGSEQSKSGTSIIIYMVILWVGGAVFKDFMVVQLLVDLNPDRNSFSLTLSV